MMRQILHVFVFLIQILLPNTNAAKVLLFPLAQGKTSHLTDMIAIAEMLQKKSHDVHILINSRERIYFENRMLVKVEVHEFEPPSNMTGYQDQDFQDDVLKQAENDSQAGVESIFSKMYSYCENLISDEKLLLSLKKEHFDLFIPEIADPCGRIITYYLNAPTIGFNGVGIMMDASFSPNLPSLSPLPLTGWKPTEMSFAKRVINVILSCAFQLYLKFYFFAPFDQLMKKYNLNKHSKVENAYVDKIVMTMIDAAIDYPRPLYPNIISVGGMLNYPASPLNNRFEELFNSSGDEGVILVSFGTLMDSFPEYKANEIAFALSKLPQKVIWSHRVNKPEQVGNNTLVVDWVPQNDILGDKRTKLFVTHGGLHSCYEAAYHGVPVVVIPLFYDQYDNAERITNRAKMGMQLSFRDLNRYNLLKTIKSVLNNPYYTEKALETSKLLKDQPLSPKDRFLFYVDYVIRHRGEIRLHGELLTELSTVQYYMLDVIVFLIFIILCFCKLSHVTMSWWWTRSRWIPFFKKNN